MRPVETDGVIAEHRLFTKPVPSTAIVAWLEYVETLVSPERGLLDWRAQGWRDLPLTPGT